MTRTPLPDPPAADFKRRLRAELIAAEQAQSLRRWRGACVGAAAVASLCVAALALFVARPELPGRLHAGLTGDPAAVAELSVERDREFLEALYTEASEPVRVTAVHNERVLAIREFTLSDGKRMTVYTELGDGGESLIARSAETTRSTF